MEQTDNESVLSFDTLYTNNHIQILKILLPCFDNTMQKRLAILIKFLEFQYTLQLFQKNPSLSCFSCRQDTASKGKVDIVEIFAKIKAFCTPSERAMFDQLASIKKSMEQYEEIMQMMQLFSDLSGKTDTAEKEASSAGSDFSATEPFIQETVNPMDILKNMLSPEQQSMFELFQSAFPDNSTDQ